MPRNSAANSGNRQAVRFDSGDSSAEESEDERPYEQEDETPEAGQELPHQEEETLDQKEMEHQRRQHQLLMRRLLQRPHTAGAPFLDAMGNRTQPSRDQQQQQVQQPKKKLGKRRRRPQQPGAAGARPKTALGIEHQQQKQQQQGAAGGGSEPNFPTLNPRVFHALRGFLTPESLRKTRFYSDREERMVARRVQLDQQEERLQQRIGVFYRRLDSFITETNAAANWEPEDKRKQKSLLENLDTL